MLSVFLLLIIYWLLLCLVWNNKKKNQKIIYSIIYLYIGNVLLLTVLPNNIVSDFRIYYDSSLIHSHFNLILFRDIKMGYQGAFKDIILNIIMFIPFGFLIPLVSLKTNFYKIIVFSFLFSLIIEFIQLITTLLLLNNRICDITDLFTNTIGGMIGYFIYWIIKNKKHKSI